MAHGRRAEISRGANPPRHRWETDPRLDLGGAEAGLQGSSNVAILSYAEPAHLRLLLQQFLPHHCGIYVSSTGSDQ